MSITKTRITVSATGERPKTFEEDGQQSSINATGLSPNTQYTVSAEVDDSQYGTIQAGSTRTFTTLVAGSLTLSNVTGVWQTNTAQLNFSASWSSTYNLNASPNFKILVSKLSDFSTYQEVTPGFVNYGTYGTVSANLTAYLPFTPAGSYYYVKVRATDIYHTVMYSAIQTFQLPTNGSAGDTQYLTFSTHQQANGYTYWLPTNIAPNQFTYYPYRKYIVFSTDNWATESRTANYNYPNNVEIFYSFEPNDYKLELEVMDIYGELFRTNQGTEIKVDTPRAFFGNTTRGSAYYWIRVNPNRVYDSVLIYYNSTDGQGISDTVDLLPLSSYDQIRGEIQLPDGDYQFYVEVKFSTETRTSETANVTVTNVGWLFLTNTCTIYENGDLDWSADFDSEYPLINDCIVTLYDENDSEIGHYEAIYDTETTNGSMKLADTINIDEYPFVWCSVRVDDEEGNSLYAEFTVKEE